MRQLLEIAKAQVYNTFMLLFMVVTSLPYAIVIFLAVNFLIGVTVSFWVSLGSVYLFRVVLTVLGNE